MCGDVIQARHGAGETEMIWAKSLTILFIMKNVHLPHGTFVSKISDSD
jgi:hypothetical protein